MSARAAFNFPHGFLLGTATAAYQVEGNNTNSDWWGWENEPGRIKQGHKSGLACDWWGGRWKEDFDRAAEAGQNAHRFSIEWSRIQLAPDKWDDFALEHYREMARGLRERNMVPMVTLQHFSLPQWLAERGGWEDETIAGVFEAFVQKVVAALAEYVDLWVTINEPNTMLIEGYITGHFPPGEKNLPAALRAGVNMVRAHTAAYYAIHRLQPKAKVGISLYFRGLEPAIAWSPFDRLAADLQFRMGNAFFPSALSTGVLNFPVPLKKIKEANGTQDFLGLAYYTRDRVSFSLQKAVEMFGHRFFLDSDELGDTGFIANVPAGIFQAIRWGARFSVPLIITENGVPDANDHLRPRYLIQHLQQVWKAVKLNYPVKGYFHWTLVDNFEWERGWTQRFGLWELDMETQVRHKRLSADLYAAICRENGITPETVAFYAPKLLEVKV